MHFRCVRAVYLPASWYHEVISYSQNSKENKSSESNGAGVSGASVHLAFNIWLHPPMWQGTFDEPYPDDFWAQHAACQIEHQKAASANAGTSSRTSPVSIAPRRVDTRGHSIEAPPEHFVNSLQCGFTVPKQFPRREAREAVSLPERGPRQRSRSPIPAAGLDKRRLSRALAKLRCLRQGRGTRDHRRRTQRRSLAQK